MSLNNSANGASPAPDDNVRYDLAGNPLPPLPAAAPPAGAYPPPILPAASAPPRFAPPPGAVPPSFQPPPGAAAPAWGGTAAPAPRSAAGPVLYIGLGVAAVVLLGLIFGLRAMKPVLVTAPTSYQTYTALDSSFSCDRPAGWKMQEAGSQGGSLSWVSFEIGHARVKVVSDAAGSLLSESTNAANANLPPEQQTPPVAKLHEADKSQLAELIDGLPGGLGAEGHADGRRCQGVGMDSDRQRQIARLPGDDAEQRTRDHRHLPVAGAKLGRFAARLSANH